ncbi:MAG: GNAT family N-acetyltransferase [Candidatus Lokiarchaeota archaeon]|nr:GNAT family N-acetyltransferase [Candidatus Lokiarchaeota archaeon]
MSKFDIDNWQEINKDKEIKPEDLNKIIKPGYRIAVGSACSEPLLLTNKLLQEKEWNLPDVQICHFFTLSNHKFYSETTPTRFRHNTLSIIGSEQMRVAINQGKSDFTPINTSEIPRMLKGKRYKIDVALIQVSPPDKNGYCSLGINVGINRTMTDSARIIVAHINPNMPRTMGNSFILFKDIDYYVYEKAPLMQVRFDNTDEIINRIAKYVARLIENGSTLNIGLGKIAYALPFALLKAGTKNLAIYSEVLYDSVMDLVENGNINCSKNYYPHCMTSFILGSKEFYEFVDDNPFIEFHSTEFLLNIENIVKNNKLCSVYSAMSVDLFGQTSNHLKHVLYSGVGGQADFTYGASKIERGKSIIAIRSITKGGYSRILPVLPSGLVALRSIDVHYVVTEWGIAQLHGKTVRERVLQMIGVAHPQFRQDLLNKAKKMHLVYEDQEIPTTQDGVVVICPDIEWDFRTKSKGVIHFAPVKPTDERMIQDLYYSLSESDRVMRFFSPQKIFSHKETQSRIMCDYNTNMVIVGIVGNKEEDQRIVAAGAYYLVPNTNLVEFSVTIHEDYRKQGLGRHILNKIIEIAQEKGYEGIVGDVYVDNIAMLQILNTLPYDVVFTSDEDDSESLQFQFLFKSKKNKERIFNDIDIDL